MSILVVGSVALDTVTTPFGTVKDALGGSGVYFSIAASYFTPVSLVAVVGEDFPDRHVELLKRHHVDMSGLSRASGKTFRWTGEYTYDLNTAHTLDTQLNVFASFKPTLPVSYRESKYVFLANIDPVLQREVLRQVKDPKLVAADTMNFWIESKRAELKKTLKYVHILVVNEAEARELAKEKNLIKAARVISSWGPNTVVIKRGEYGALCVNRTRVFAAPAFPLEEIMDPTGAGDSFAGGFMGYMAWCGSSRDSDLRHAIIFGSVMASFNVEGFSVDRLAHVSRKTINARFEQFRKLTQFDALRLSGK